MKAVIYKLTHLNGRKRVYVMLGCLALALVITITGAFAWASYTGVAAEGNLKNPDDEPKDLLGFVSGGVVVVGSPDPDPEGMPFQCDGAVIKNPNKYPLLIRVSLKEMHTHWPLFASTETVPPANCKPVLSSREALNTRIAETGWKELPGEKIIWDTTLLGPRPNEFHFFYQLTPRPGQQPMYSCWAYRDMYDAANNWIGANGAFVNHPQLHLRDETTIDSLWFDSGSAIRYFYYSENLGTKKTQWADIPLSAPPSGGDAWASDSSWNVVRPTLDKVVKNWSDTTPLVVLQTYESIFAADNSRVYLPAPALTKTLTKNKWFYNEADGYFYYLGVLNHNESVFAPLDVENPVNTAPFYNGWPVGETDIVSKDFTFRVYGEAIEANTQAAAELWGLTFEPGSLGAMIFE